MFEMLSIVEKTNKLSHVIFEMFSGVKKSVISYIAM